MAFTPADPTKAEVRIVGTAPNQQLDFYIPRGAKGEPGGWNTGTDLATTTNLNDIKTPGLYRNWNNTAATALNNYPTGAINATCTIEVTVAANPTGDVIQRVFPYSGNANILRVMYMRRCLNGTWNSWQTFSTTRVDQTAGRVIYQWDDVNSREQLIYGDTGWRNIASDQAWLDALFAAGATINGANTVRVRRSNNLVELVWAVDKAAGTVTVAQPFPLGFRPAQPFTIMGSNSALGQVRVYHGGGGVAAIYQTPTVQNAVTCMVVYSTNDAWPTALPGTAIGSIPNV